MLKNKIYLVAFCMLLGQKSPANADLAYSGMWTHVGTSCVKLSQKGIQNLLANPDMVRHDEFRAFTLFIGANHRQFTLSRYPNTSCIGFESEYEMCRQRYTTNGDLSEIANGFSLINVERSRVSNFTANHMCDLRQCDLGRSADPKFLELNVSNAVSSCPSNELYFYFQQGENSLLML